VPSMRLTRADLFQITHYKTPRCQAAWFLEHLGASVPCDRDGPILTPASYEALLAKRLGVGIGEQPQRPRPTVQLRNRK